MEKEKLNDYGILAKIVSFVFHPALMPLYGLTIILFAPTLLSYLPYGVKKIIFLIFLTNNVIISLSVIPFLRYRNIINSWEMEDKSERVIPLFIASVLYFVTTYILFKFQVPVFLKAYAFSSSILVLLCAVISTRWKISIHSVGSGALIATILLLSIKMYINLEGFIISALLISGLVLSARLKLNSHTPVQVYTGFITGFLVVGFFISLF
jgi:membrane-associated phospholipid phosphatase